MTDRPLTVAPSAAADHPAIVDNGREVSYAELRGLVATVARRLGDRPGVVGVSATHSLATIVGLYGVWAAGGTYCPVDPAFPAARRDAMLAGCQWWLTPDGLMWLTPGPALDDIAYILFTSGSTGEPKPVLTPRRAIDTTVAALGRLFGLTPADRVLQFASLNWDTCFEEILPTLSDRRDAGVRPRRPLRLVAAVPARGGTGAGHRARPADRVLARARAPPARGRAALPDSVRLVVIGGEAANPARLARLARPGHGARPVAQHVRVHRDHADHARHRAAVAGRHGPDRLRRCRTSSSASARTANCSSAGPALATGYRDLPEATATGSSSWTGSGSSAPATGYAGGPTALLLHRGPARRRGEDPGRPGRSGRGRGTHRRGTPAVAGGRRWPARTVAGRTSLVGVRGRPTADRRDWTAGRHRRLPAHPGPGPPGARPDHRRRRPRPHRQRQGRPGRAHRRPLRQPKEDRTMNVDADARTSSAGCWRPTEVDADSDFFDARRRLAAGDPGAQRGRPGARGGAVLRRVPAGADAGRAGRHDRPPSATERGAHEGRRRRCRAGRADRRRRPRRAAGAEVTVVLEARDRVGGRTHGIEVAPGSWVDAGAAYLGDRHTELTALMARARTQDRPRPRMVGDSRFDARRRRRTTRPGPVPAAERGRPRRTVRRARRADRGGAGRRAVAEPRRRRRSTR